MTGPVTLLAQDPASGRRRYYKLFIAPSLFGEWLLVREWGRIGSPGRVMNSHFDNAGAALLAMQDLVRTRLKRGYSVTRPS
jgi:predicted DNA-binding WGR domain protein